jgi:hypothetical protein
MTRKLTLSRPKRMKRSGTRADGIVFLNSLPSAKCKLQIELAIAPTIRELVCYKGMGENVIARCPTIQRQLDLPAPAC